MSASSSTDFTPSEGRRFAFPVGTAFLALAALLWWRDKEIAMWITAGLGGLLYVGGLVAPAQLGPVYRAWMKLALVISKVTTPIFMGVVYYVVIAPAGLIRRTFGKDALRHEKQPESGYWRQVPQDRHSDLKRQF